MNLHKEQTITLLKTSDNKGFKPILVQPEEDSGIPGKPTLCFTLDDVRQTIFESLEYSDVHQEFPNFSKEIVQAQTLEEIMEHDLIINHEKIDHIVRFFDIDFANDYPELTREVFLGYCPKESFEEMAGGDSFAMPIKCSLSGAVCPNGVDVFIDYIFEDGQHIGYKTLICQFSEGTANSNISIEWIFLLDEDFPEIID